MNTTRLFAISAACVLGGFLVGCGADPKPAPASPGPQPPAAKSEVKPVSPSIAVSDDLAKACSLHLNDVASAPKFDFDNSELLPGDRAVLEKIVQCLTTGPLKGKSLSLVGRADPRGEAQYNMALGAHRATHVAKVLTESGLESKRAKVTSRGELDAAGTDESGWQTDRRVDITLAR